MKKYASRREQLLDYDYLKESTKKNLKIVANPLKWQWRWGLEDWWDNLKTAAVSIRNCIALPFVLVGAILISWLMFLLWPISVPALAKIQQMKNRRADARLQAELEARKAPAQEHA